MRASACSGAVALATEFPRSEFLASLRSSACSEALTLVSGIVRTGASMSLVDYAVPGGELPVRHLSRSGSRLLVDCHRNSGFLPPSQSCAQLGPPAATPGTACSDPLLLVIDHAHSDPSTSLQSSACSEATFPVASAQLDFPLLTPDWVSCGASSSLRSFARSGFLLSAPESTELGALPPARSLQWPGSMPLLAQISRTDLVSPVLEHSGIGSSLLPRTPQRLGTLSPAFNFLRVDLTTFLPENALSGVTVSTRSFS